ncbi:MAG: hypothetical protein MUP70_06830, partial [Candidatus Aminicenantes bacterium]|nr:hypothetical protein [Candidatus Aminicenantes bacterium]
EVSDGKGSNHLITGQKQEALWAAGKIGLPALACGSVLQEYATHTSSKLRTCLAWTLGELGKAQKMALNGISVDIITSLLHLMKTEDRPVFEESIVALKKIGMPDFLHALYFYHIGAVSILGLKPAQKGLYELSETIHELIRTKGQAVIAVTGDSGTGKTYFCQALKEGVGSVQSSEILYLMRDRKKDQKIFNRILGLEWLNLHIEPEFYQDDPVEEYEDDPRNYLEAFFEGNRDKKLILLDGCRDKTYFQRVIDLFYFYGKLDVEVNFRAAYSTRRFNLEIREAALESVGTHIAFLEEPVLEDTLFYKEGKILLYDLDNSTPHRLNKEDIQDLFQKSRITSWEHLIRIGRFPIRPGSVNSRTVVLKTSEKETYPIPETLPKGDILNIDHGEQTIQVDVPSSAPSPFLLGTVDAGDLKPCAIRLYAQEQLAGITEDGQLYVLTFLDNRLFTIPFGPLRTFVLQNRNFYIVDRRGQLHAVSFERNTHTVFPATSSPILCLSPLLVDQVVTGHEDGSIRIWDFINDECRVFEGTNPIMNLMTDYFGRIYALDSNGRLTIRQSRPPHLIQIDQPFSGVSSWGLYSADKIILLSGSRQQGKAPEAEGGRKSVLSIFDREKGTVTTHSLPFHAQEGRTHVLRDGRILLAVRKGEKHHPADPENGLALLSPEGDKFRIESLDSGSFGFFDFVPLGPRIFTCGPYPDGKLGFSIWAAESYTLHQRGRTSLFD